MRRRYRAPKISGSIYCSEKKESHDPSHAIYIFQCLFHSILEYTFSEALSTNFSAAANRSALLSYTFSHPR